MKDILKRLARLAGYEVRPATTATADPFRQQKVLLSGVPAPVIFDVGANTGTITRKYRSAFPDALIYAFEPFAGVFEQLERSVCRDARVRTYRLALGSLSSKATLRVNASAPTNSLLETDDLAKSFWGGGIFETSAKVEVEVVTLDSFCMENQIDRIDILKLDTQGTEQQILEGAHRMLSESRIRVIYMEIIVSPTYVGQSKPQDLICLLADAGYILFGLYNLDSRKDGRLRQMDAIFLRSRE